GIGSELDILNFAPVHEGHYKSHCRNSARKSDRLGGEAPRLLSRDEHDNDQERDHCDEKNHAPNHEQLRITPDACDRWVQLSERDCGLHIRLECRAARVDSVGEQLEPMPPFEKALFIRRDRLHGAATHRKSPISSLVPQVHSLSSMPSRFRTSSLPRSWSFWR